MVSRMKLTFLEVAGWLVLGSITACAEPGPRARTGPAPQAAPRTTPAPRSDAEGEVRAALAAHDASTASCRSASAPLACVSTVRSPGPCDPPREPYAASFTGLREEALGAYYFDGAVCYEATVEAPGRCAMGAECHAWTTHAACEAARRICDAR
jgi:hypothetical protein